MSRRSVGLPCSRSRTKRSPTPDYNESSSCVRLYCLRNILTVADRLFISISLYTFSGAKIVQIEGRITKLA